MVEPRHHRRAPLLETFDNDHLPQRAVGWQWPRHHLAQELVELGAAAR